MPPDEQAPDPDAQTDDQPEPTEPSLEDLDSALVEELYEIAPPGLARRMDTGDVVDTEDVVGDQAWNRIKALDPDLAQRIEDVAARRSAEREERERLKKEQVVTEEEGHELNVLPPEERAVRLQEQLQEQVVQEFQDIKAGYAELQHKNMPEELRETKRQALEARIAAAEKLADTVRTPTVSLPFLSVTKTTNPAARVDAWQQADPHTRALATALFGVTGPVDIDVDSEGYAAAIETARKEAADQQAWIDQQVNMARNRRAR